MNKKAFTSITLGSAFGFLLLSSAAINPARAESDYRNNDPGNYRDRDYYSRQEARRQEELRREYELRSQEDIRRQQELLTQAELRRQEDFRRQQELRREQWQIERERAQQQ